MNASLDSGILSGLNLFRGHGLSDLKNAELMNRVDTKFLVHRNMIPTILDEMKSDFTALEINSTRSFRYRSTYYDTKYFDFYHMHHRGSLNRFKVRVREYLDSGSTFLEVKFKNNKSRTIKTRTQISGVAGDSLSEYQEFLAKNGVLDASLMVSQVSDYERIALASEVRKERLTIDYNLGNTFGGARGYPRVGLNDLAIVELKQQKMNRESPFFSLVRKLGVRPSGFSKYCMGMVYTASGSSEIKSNRFKRVCRRVDGVLSRCSF